MKFASRLLVIALYAFLLAGYDRHNAEGGDHTWNGRARIDYDTGGAFRMTLTGDYSNTDSSQLPNTVLATTGFIPGPFAGLNPNDLGPAFGSELTGTEVRYLMKTEWARFPDDVLWRRTKLGLTMPVAGREALAAFMASAA